MWQKAAVHRPRGHAPASAADERASGRTGAVQLDSCVHHLRISLSGVVRTGRTTGAARTNRGYGWRESGVVRTGGRVWQLRPPHRVPANLWRTGIMAEALWSSRPPGRAVELERDMPAPAARNRDAKDVRCSFCQVELGADVELTIPESGKHGQRTSTSSFCSTHCRDCVLALAALHPSPLASRDFISRRALLTDRLLDLWRHGHGPDPALVLQAARTASTGFASSDAV